MNNKKKLKIKIKILKKQIIKINNKDNNKCIKKNK